MTNFSINENEPLTVQHMEWLGFENVNGSMVKEGYGDVQFYNKEWHYCEKDKAIRILKTNKDLNDIYLKRNIE